MILFVVVLAVDTGDEGLGHGLREAKGCGGLAASTWTVEEAKARFPTPKCSAATLFMSLSLLSRSPFCHILNHPPFFLFFFLLFFLPASLI